MSSKNDKKRLYTVRRRFQIVATVGIIMLILLFSLFFLYITYKASGRFVQQVVQMGRIKNFEIQSKAIA